MGINKVEQYRLTEFVTFAIQRVKRFIKLYPHFVQTNFKRFGRHKNTAQIFKLVYIVNQHIIYTNHFTTRIKGGANPHHLRFLNINVMSKLSNSSMQMLIIDCKSHRDADIKIRSSAYMMHPKNSSPIRHPRLDLLNFSITSLTYTAKSIGERTPPCLTPQARTIKSDNMLSHLT